MGDGEALQVYYRVFIRIWAGRQWYQRSKGRRGAWIIECPGHIATIGNCHAQIENLLSNIDRSSVLAYYFYFDPAVNTVSIDSRSCGTAIDGIADLWLVSAR